MHRCDSASSTVAVTPPGPCAVAGKVWKSRATACRPAAFDGLDAGGAQRLRIEQPARFALAIVEVGGEVQAVHGAAL